jgi:hypothetical protein
MSVRKSALFALVSSVAALLIPMCRDMRTMLAIGARGYKWSYIFAVWTGVFALTLPVFFLALFLNNGTLRLPPKLQRVSVKAALFTGLIAAIEPLRRSHSQQATGQI